MPVTQVGRRGKFQAHVAADCSISVGAEIADARIITIQLKDMQGNNITYAEQIELTMLLNAGGLDFVVTGGTTGIAQSTAGKILAIVAKKIFRAITDITGKLVVTYTDTGTEVGFLGVRLPSGVVFVSTALTNT